MVLVLVVDDDSELLDSLCAVLEAERFGVIALDNATDALIEFGICRPDVVVTDVVMDQVDGIELVKSVRKIDKNIPIIAMSGNERYLNSLTKLGATYSLLKPFSAQQLLDAIEAAISS